MREDPAKDGVINIPVACVTDMDVMPDMAPWIVGKRGPANTRQATVEATMAGQGGFPRCE